MNYSVESRITKMCDLLIATKRYYLEWPLNGNKSQAVDFLLERTEYRKKICRRKIGRGRVHSLTSTTAIDWMDSFISYVI